MALVAGFVLAQVAAVTPTPQADLEACLAQCADCHPAESAAYAGTAMARALGGLRPGELSDLAPVEDARSGFTYAFEGERVVETRALPSGAPWRDAAAVAFAIGAGTVDRAYAVRRGGRLWLAPLELLTKDGERRAALAPAHVIRPGTRFDQPVTTECLACHTDHLPPRDWPLNREPEGFAVRGISCAACHADLPGHVAARSAELEGGRGPPDPLQAERAWSRTLDMERCAACHLQGDARIELVPGRVGPPPPGTPLLASRAVFVEREPREEIGFVSHVERLVLSRCYLDSIARADGGLRCESCHDPHRALSEPDERARVRAACLACHADRDAAPGEAARCTLERAARPPQRDCVDCHMRRTGVFDVAEVEIHDHWIRRRTPEPSRAGPLRFPASPTGDWRLFAWPGEAAPDAGDPGPWTLALAHGGHLERAREQAARGTGQRAALLPMLHHVRGSLFERAGELAAARAAYQRALELDPTLAEATINLAPLLARMGSPDAGLALLDDLLALHPLADTAYRNRAVIHAALDDEPSFRADLEAAQRLRPDAELARALARHAERRRDEEAVRRWTAEAHRLDPR